MRWACVVGLVLGFCFPAGALAQEAKTKAAQSGKTPNHADLRYVPGGHERQKLDLYLPMNSKNAPLVVWLHGGQWRSGDKRKPRAIFLLEEGFAVASVNYRYSNQAVFPAQIQDCKAAIRFLRANAKKFGYDGDVIGVWGESAGGHLAALLGTAANVKDWDVGPHLNVTSRVQAVVDYWGPTDFLQLNDMAGPEGKINHDAADSPESLLIGGPIQKNQDKARQANPITYTSKGDPPFLIVHGDKDNQVPPDQSSLLQLALLKVGGDTTLQWIKGAGHDIAPKKEVDYRVIGFFRTYLRKKNERR